jgi:hypothetical protein
MRFWPKRSDHLVKATATASGPLDVRSLPRNIYRRFLYLDSDGVMNSLSSLEGGDIDEVLERILSVKEGHAGLALDVWAANISAGGKLDKESELKWTRRRTVHSAITTLLAALDQQHEIQRFDHVPRPDELDENMLIEFRGTISLGAGRRPSENGQSPDGGSEGQQANAAEQDTKEDEQDNAPKQNRKAADWLHPWRLLPGLKPEQLSRMLELGDSCVGFVTAVNGPLNTKPAIYLGLESKYFVIDDPREFSRQATIVAQVEGTVREDEVVVVEPSGSATTVAIRRGSRDGNDSSKLPHALVVLKPLCIYKASDATPRDGATPMAGPLVAPNN